MIVIDANVAIWALLARDPRGDRADAALAEDPEWWVPAAFFGEVLAICRRDGGPDADGAVNDLIEWDLQVVDSRLLLKRVWQLRHNVSTYDAFYVAAAEHLGCSLLTADGKLSAAPGPRCTFVTL